MVECEILQQKMPMGKKHPHLASHLGDFFLTTGNSSPSYHSQWCSRVKGGNRSAENTALRLKLFLVASLGSFSAFRMSR